MVSAFPHESADVCVFMGPLDNTQSSACCSPDSLFVVVDNVYRSSCCGGCRFSFRFYHSLFCMVNSHLRRWRTGRKARRDHWLKVACLSAVVFTPHHPLKKEDGEVKAPTIICTNVCVYLFLLSSSTSHLFPPSLLIGIASKTCPSTPWPSQTAHWPASAPPPSSPP